MPIVVAGVNHKTAPVEIRERLAFSENHIREFLTLLPASSFISGVVLSTCNRTEIYAALKENSDPQQGIGELKSFLAAKAGFPQEKINKYLYFCQGYEAVQHLFRVISGLDSMILGETQILGQVKKAYQITCRQNQANSLIHNLFQQALSVGKKVRTQTGIDQNSVSVSYTAVELAKQIFGDLHDRTVLILGAGKMSELTALHLVANGVSSVIVSNRSYDRAVELAARFKGLAVRFDQLQKYLLQSDIVISCTAAAHFIIRKSEMETLLQPYPDKKIMLIDIAVPRDIEPEVGALPGVSLYNVDDLNQVIDTHLEERQQAAKQAEQIIKAEVDEFSRWYAAQLVTPVITNLRGWGEAIKKQELDKALAALGQLSEHDQKVVCSLAAGIVNKLLHNPTANLKKYALTPEGSQYVQVSRDLFGLD